MRRVIAVLACAACGRVGFGALAGDGGGFGDDGGSGSGSGSGSAMDLSNACISPGYGDGFDEVLPCHAFGMPSVSNATMNVMNSQLTITPNASVGTTAGCERLSASFDAAGLFIEISQVLPAPGETILVVTDTTSATYILGFSETAGQLRFSDGATTNVMQPYDPTLHRWWRIRPVATKTIAETSPDGTHWNLFATSDLAAPTLVSITAYTETTAADMAPGTAVFQGIDVCPP